MKKINLSKLFATASLSLIAASPILAQSNLGASCGCPAVSTRPEVIVSSMAGYTAVTGTYGGELTTGAAFTCDKTYILDKKIYIPAGQVLTIEPGTVIKGGVNTVAAEATALVIERGGKIIASGTESCPIVFTAYADAVNGTYPIANKGMWGGIVLLGKASNNLNLAENGPFVVGGTSGKLAAADGLGVIEGFATNNYQDRYGVNTSTSVVAGELSSQSFDDNDNSGILRYVSIRHAGAILAVGAEINGLTLGSVGRGTTIEHIEIVSCADDNIEFFGGTVNVKYVTTLFGNDDMFDWDLGWSGNAQFLFGMKSDLTSSLDNDNGFESDNDDGKSYSTPFSNPTIYNVTLVGNAKTPGNSDNSALAAINAKEFTKGSIYNSVFANFRNGFNMAKSVTSTSTVPVVGSRTYVEGGDAWHNWTNNPSSPALATSSTGNGTLSLKVKCNTFVGMTNALTTGASSSSAGTVLATTSADYIQFTQTDKNDVVAGNTLPGFNYNFTVNTATNVFSVKNDVVPNPALSTVGCPTAPVNGFFEPANYRGAFSSTGDNWLSDWSYSALLNSTNGVAACPTDLNYDGVTDVNDFLIFGPAFGTSCN
ncbi:MAG: hypothetical protein NTY55_01500 [Flavobacteriia bacterium]|nr:hypothetical protein [Flavobacteriia bacterium]